MDMQEFSQQIQGKIFLGDLRMQKDEANINFCEKLVMHENAARGITALPFQFSSFLSIQSGRKAH